MAKFKRQKVRDPVHNLIEFAEEEFENAMWQVIQTRPFQRLRRIKQLGFSELVYPGATHTRLAHSIGVFHTARKLMEIIRRHVGSGIEISRERTALAAALVHDVGHGPFSHAFEAVGKELKLTLAHHERVSDALIRDSEVAGALQKLGGGFAADVAGVIKSRGPGNLYNAVVSSQFDADRLDYIRRDRLMTGTQAGAIDFEWLVSNLQLDVLPNSVDGDSAGDIETFVLGSKARFAAEAYVLGLFQMYPTVYFHKTTRGAEKLFAELLARTIKMIRDGSKSHTALPKNHPLVEFAEDPENLERVLNLDDSVLWGSLSLLKESDDPVISEFAGRLRDRKLYKCIDIRTELQKNGVAEENLDRVCSEIFQRVEQWRSEAPQRRTEILFDQEQREPYKRFEDSKGPLNQIRIRQPNGSLVDLGEESKIVKSIETYKLARAYVPDLTCEAAKHLKQVMKEAH